MKMGRDRRLSGQHKDEQRSSGHLRNYFKYALLAGAMAGCGYTAIRYEIARLPNNGDSCPSLGNAIQVYQGQEVGFGPGRRPLYLARMNSLDGTDITMEMRMPLAPATASGVSWVVTFGGLRTDVEGIARTANTMCGLAGVRRGAALPRDGGSAGAENQPDAAVQADAESAGAGGEGGSPAIALLEAMAQRMRSDAGPPPPVELERPPELDSHGGAFPPDSSADFARTLRENLGRAISSLQSLMAGREPSGGDSAFTVTASDERTFTLSAGGQTIRLSRRAEMQWDVSTPTAATLRIPYRITRMSTQGGALSVEVAVDCSRDMEAAGDGLGVRRGPHPACR